MQVAKMEKSEVIKLLEFVRDIDGEVETRREMLKGLDQYYDTTSAINYDGMPKGQNHISSPTETAALNIPDFVSKDIKTHKAEIRELQLLKTEIIKEVVRLKLKYKRVIMYFYFQNMQWQQVADLTHYSERQCKNIRDEAVDQLAAGFQNNKVIASYRIKE